jgi:hypothetical protein
MDHRCGPPPQSIVVIVTLINPGSITYRLGRGCRSQKLPITNSRPNSIGSSIAGTLLVNGTPSLCDCGPDYGLVAAAGVTTLQAVITTGGTLANRPITVLW